MKWLFILVALPLVFSLLAGCNSTNDTTPPSTQTPIPTQPVTQTPTPTPTITQTPSQSNTSSIKYTLLLSVNPAGGGTVKIANLPNGEFDYDTLQAIAEIKSNYSASYDAGQSLVLAVKAADGYVFDSWSGSLEGTSVVLSFDIESNMKIVANFKAAATQTPPLLPQAYQVLAETTVNKTTLSIGDNLTIQSELQYIGDESSISGVPIIMIMDANYNVVAAWYLDQQGNLLLQNVPMTYYQIEKDKRYIVNVTWDLKNIYTKVSVPPGQYQIRVTIAIPYSNGFSPLLTDEMYIYITIS